MAPSASYLPINGPIILDLVTKTAESTAWARKVVFIRMGLNFDLLQTNGQLDRRFKEFIEKKQYDRITKLGKNIDNDEFFKHLCPLLTTLEHYKGLAGCLKRRGMIPTFLVYGDMELAREAIAKFEEYDTKCCIERHHKYSALTLSLNNNMHDRFINLLVAIYENCVKNYRREKLKYGSRYGHLEDAYFFGIFLDNFFGHYAPEKNSRPLKRFLTLCREGLQKEHPILFESFCLELVQYLRFHITNPDTQKLFVDLIGQPFLLTSTAFVKAFLVSSSMHNDYLILYGWREAIKEGLEGGYAFGGEKLLTELAQNTLPEEISREYPYSAEAQAVILEKFPTKRQLEEEWAEKNAPTLQGELQDLAFGLLPHNILSAISRYAVTWIVSPQNVTNDCKLVQPDNQALQAEDSSQGQSVRQANEQFFERFKKLIDEGKYWEAARLGNFMDNEEFLSCAYSVMTTFEHFQGFYIYLDLRNVIKRIFAYGSITFVRKIIVEFKDAYFERAILDDTVRWAIILSMDEDRYDRVVDLFEAIQEKYAIGDERLGQIGEISKFRLFMDDFIGALALNDRNGTIKRFFALHGENFKSKYRSIFEVFCLSLVHYLRNKSDHPRPDGIVG